jgi:hypothetical protein
MREPLKLIRTRILSALRMDSPRYNRPEKSIELKDDRSTSVFGMIEFMMTSERKF